MPMIVYPNQAPPVAAALRGLAGALMDAQGAGMPVQTALARIPPWLKYAAIVGGALGAYHGYKRDDSVGWAILWSIFGSGLPFLAVPIALAQGFGKRAR